MYHAVPDGRPMIGEVPGLGRLILATGHEGEGLALVLPPFSFKDFKVVSLYRQEQLTIVNSEIVTRVPLKFKELLRKRYGYTSVFRTLYDYTHIYIGSASRSLSLS